MNDQGGLIAERESFNNLGKLLHGLLGPGDDRVEFTANVTASTNEQHIYIYNPDGRFSSPKGAFNDADGSFELSQAMKELRRAAYKPGSGTWFSMNMVVTSKGSATAEYNYDDEPQWDFPVASAAYVHDQEKFPRDENHMPTWLKQKLQEGH
ncbi:hypothetical protein CQ020_22700 [Arthrobacter sp. MYb23]|uniref:immunity protein YezG family protein n=1 Tax=unclassified Arthrobacter TaxID=235627 RepID=UPI000CFC0A86|nr:MULTISPECIES: immunity protein YezG family protein [unclassified Arthrobacter]PRB42586.1 hypothetical protein CQ038_09040 [Arthrobacter sp. MYb51]PRB89158.1 hypothetical protein CQ020_22700 [Arthrobacter sp. MYb23]